MKTLITASIMFSSVIGFVDNDLHASPNIRIQVVGSTYIVE
jgi:hypothetical protein